MQVTVYYRAAKNIYICFFNFLVGLVVLKNVIVQQKVYFPEIIYKTWTNSLSFDVSVALKNLIVSKSVCCKVTFACNTEYSTVKQCMKIFTRLKYYY